MQMSLQPAGSSLEATPRRVRRNLPSVVFLSILSLLVGCSAEPDRVGTGGTSGAGASGKGGGGDGGSTLSFGNGGGGSCDPTCSSDLHAVMNCNSVAKTCPPDQGCAAGACVPACEA